jgi:hypothetical protein
MNRKTRATPVQPVRLPDLRVTLYHLYVRLLNGGIPGKMPPAAGRLCEQRCEAGRCEEQPFSVVPYPDNTTHVDPGMAVPGASNPFFLSRASTDGRSLTADFF